jgi:hypothetical protein
MRRKTTQIHARSAKPTKHAAASDWPAFLHWNNSRMKNAYCINGF